MTFLSDDTGTEDDILKMNKNDKDTRKACLMSVGGMKNFVNVGALDSRSLVVGSMIGSRYGTGNLPIMIYLFS